MKLLEALKNINYKDVIVRALWTFACRRLPRHFYRQGVNLVNLLFAASWRELYALDTSHCSVCNRGWIIAAKTLALI